MSHNQSIKEHRSLSGARERRSQKCERERERRSEKIWERERERRSEKSGSAWRRAALFKSKKMTYQNAQYTWILTFC